MHSAMRLQALPSPGEAAVLSIETHVREQLQVRVRVSLLPHASLPKNAYKNSLLAVRGVN